MHNLESHAGSEKADSVPIGWQYKFGLGRCPGNIYRRRRSSHHLGGSGLSKNSKLLYAESATSIELY